MHHTNLLLIQIYNMHNTKHRSIQQHIHEDVEREPDNYGMTKREKEQAVSGGHIN